MTIELSEFYQTFFDETAEHLAAMESVLLNLNIDAPVVDDLNAIFRSAHSIKGGSGMFGFEEMTELTHILETLLDRLRKGELAITELMVDAFLEATDVLKGQVECRQKGATTGQKPAESICARLRQLAGEPSGGGAESLPPKSDADRTAAGFDIQFSRDGNALAEPAPFDWLLDSLRDLGGLEIVDPGDGPGKLTHLRISGNAALPEIHEAFAFFLQPEQIEIRRARSEDEHTVPVAPAGKHGRSGASAAEATHSPPGSEEAGAEMDERIGDSLVLPAMWPASASAEQSLASARIPDPDRQERGNEVGNGHPRVDTSIRVNIDKVDQLINLAGELVITQAMLAQTASQVDPVLQEQLMKGIALLERNTRDLQEAVMSIRMMPMSFVFSRFPRMVRDIAGKLRKEVNFSTQGEGTELDKGLIEKIVDPLTHLVRNSLDHGIEPPEARLQSGKGPKGNLSLRAFHQGGNVIIEVEDDGAGLNRARILTKARERGLPVSDGLSDQDVWQLIFAPGFSTAEVITDVSGRGVGMDVVKRNIESLGGRVEIESAPGIGTKITIRLPLTLAILDGLSIAVGSETYIVPITSIVESLQTTSQVIKTIAHQARVVYVRGEYLPVIALHEVFSVHPQADHPHQGTLMIVEADGRKAALQVDEVLAQHQVVIKSLESNYRKVPGISGATIMGDGRVALILDVAAIIRCERASCGMVEQLVEQSGFAERLVPLHSARVSRELDCESV